MQTRIADYINPLYKPQLANKNPVLKPNTSPQSFRYVQFKFCCLKGLTAGLVTKVRGGVQYICRVGLFHWHLSDSIDCFVTTKHYQHLSFKFTHFKMSRYFQLRNIINIKTIGFTHWLKSDLIWLANLTLWNESWVMHLSNLSYVIIKMVETWYTDRKLIHYFLHYNFEI